jgi:hypothetical protein
MLDQTQLQQKVVFQKEMPMDWVLGAVLLPV